MLRLRPIVVCAVLLMLGVSFGGTTAHARSRIGDVNCDSSVDSIDAVLVLQISALLAGSIECGREADANLDGTTTAVDAALILQHSAALLRLPDPIGCRSTLDYPEPNAVLDNGRTDGRDNTIWHFDWSDCENRDRYHLYVRHPASGLVIVDKDNIRQSLHHSVYYGVIPEDQRSGWQWRVRAMMKGVWSEWSSWQPFDVEKANLDPAVE